MAAYEYKKALWLATLFAVVVLAAAFLVPSSAFASSSTKAYNRSVKAVLDYQDKEGYGFSEVQGDHKEQCSLIKVDVSGLKLKPAEASVVMDRVHYDSEYWWVNLFGDNKFTTDADTGYVTSLNYPCIYTDAQINVMRKEFEQAVKLALRCTKGCKTGAQKIHALHDWMCTSCQFFYNGDARYKMAYSTLVQGIGDCSSFALSMNLLLKRCGFKTAFAENMGVDHVWNMVRLNGKWYHVDTKWDEAWSYNKSKALLWPNSICHKWLLQADFILNNDDHAGWSCIYQGAYKKITASSEKYIFETFDTWCDKVKKGDVFKRGIYTWKILGNNRVKLVKAYSRMDLTYTVPAKVTYRGTAYKVVGIAPQAFKNCKAEKVLKVASKALKKKFCKNCLKKSSFAYVKVPAARYAKYKGVFLRPKVCGASVERGNYLKI